MSRLDRRLGHRRSPARSSASTSSRWLPTGRDATSSRMARWRMRLSSWPVRRSASPIRAGSRGADAGRRRAVMRVPKVGSSSARSRASGADESAMIASAPSQPSAAERGPDLGHHAAGDDAGRRSAPRPRRRSACRACGRPRRARRRRRSAARAGGRRGPAAMPGGRVVGVDVADDAVLVAGERRDDRHLAADEDRVEQVAPQPDDTWRRGRAPGSARRSAGRRRRPTARPRRRPRSRSPATSSLLTTPRRTAAATSSDCGVGDAQAALEPARDAEALEPFGDALAAAVDEHHGPSPRDRGHLREDLALVGDGRPAQLDDEDLAHVVYS